MNNEMDSTPMDDIPNVDNGQTEQELLDAVMANSALAEAVGLGESLPDEEIPEVDPEESDDVDPESEEAVSEEEEEVEESDEEAEDEDAAEEVATQDSDVYSVDDIDLDAQVTVKVDGEEMNVSFGDLIKGYQTDAHLSKKGREIGEAQKEIDAIRDERLGELDQMAGAAAAMIGGAEQQLAKQYHEFSAQIEEARKDGNTYELGELKDKREQVQEQYHKAKKQREGMMAAVQQQKDKAEAENWQKQMDYFVDTIPTMIPDFDENVAADIRSFAIEEGIDPAALDQITDPVIVKFVDDYRRLKQGVTKGAAKRKAVPAKKAVPSRKAKTAQSKKVDAEKMVKARAFKEDASSDDQMAFLRQYASKSLS